MRGRFCAHPEARLLIEVFRADVRRDRGVEARYDTVVDLLLDALVVPAAVQPLAVLLVEPATEGEPETRIAARRERGGRLRRRLGDLLRSRGELGKAKAVLLVDRAPDAGRRGAGVAGEAFGVEEEVDKLALCERLISR